MFSGGFPNSGGPKSNSSHTNRGVDNKKLYEILGVPQDASQNDIKKSYKKKVLKAHPDKGGDDEEFKKLQAAYEVLSSPKKRELYDKYGPDGIREGGGYQEQPQQQWYQQWYQQQQQQEQQRWHQQQQQEQQRRYQQQQQEQQRWYQYQQEQQRRYQQQQQEQQRLYQQQQEQQRLYQQQQEQQRLYQQQQEQQRLYQQQQEQQRLYQQQQEQQRLYQQQQEKQRLLQQLFKERLYKEREDESWNEFDDQPHRCYGCGGGRGHQWSYDCSG